MATAVSHLSSHSASIWLAVPRWHSAPLQGIPSTCLQRHQSVCRCFSPVEKLAAVRWVVLVNRCLCSTAQSVPVFLTPCGTASPTQAPTPVGSPGKSTGAGSRSLPQGVLFPTQASNRVSCTAGQFFYHLCHLLLSQGGACANMTVGALALGPCFRGRAPMGRKFWRNSWREEDLDIPSH